MNLLKGDRNYGYFNFFKIEKSGLYRVQRRSLGKDIISKNHGLGTTEILREIKKWVEDGRTFKQTATWEVEAGAKVKDRATCYCQEIHECSNGDFILVLWKHDPDDIQGYRGLRLDKNGKPSGEFYTSNVGKHGDDVIWGHPCFYWIIPDKELVISIKFEDSKCDSKLMQKWINNCVRNRLKLKGYNKRENKEEGVRVSFSTPASPETYNLLYRFEKSIIEFSTTREHLELILSKVKYIVLRNEVNASPSQLETYELAMSSIEQSNYEMFEAIRAIIGKHFKNKETESEKKHLRRVEIKIEATPQIEDIQEFMSYADSFEEGGWADVIFIDEQDNQTSIKTHRISGRLIMGRNEGVYKASEIEQAVRELRPKYMELDVSLTRNKQEVPGGSEGKNLLKIKKTNSR